MAIAAVFSLQARHRLLAALLALSSTPSLISLSLLLSPDLHTSTSSSKFPEAETSTEKLTARLESLTELLKLRDESFTRTLTNLQARLDEPPPLPLPPLPPPPPEPFSDAAELRRLRTRVARLETMNAELHGRLAASESARADAQHAAQLAESELRTTRAVERALQVQVAELEAKVSRIATLENELRRERREADALRTEAITNARAEEELRLSARDAESRASRFESLFKSLGVGRKRGSNRSQESRDEEESGMFGIDSEDDEGDGGFWRRALQKKVDRLMPNSVVADELKQALSTEEQGGNRTVWPDAPLKGGGIVRPSRVDGLPPDGGFAGTGQENDESYTTNGEIDKTVPALAEAGAKEDGGGTFAFSRDEFSNGSATALPEGQVTEEDVEAIGTSKEDAESSEVSVNEKEEDSVGEKDEVKIVGGEESKESASLSYLQSLEERARESNDDNEGSIEILSSKSQTSDEINDDTADLSKDVEVEETEKGVLQNDPVMLSATDEIKKTAMQAEGSEEARVFAPKEAVETKNESVDAIPPSAPNNEIDSVINEQIQASKDLVKRGRQRGLSVNEADTFFQKAVDKLEEALTNARKMVEPSLLESTQSMIEGELGSSLVAWAKINIPDGSSREKLERAEKLLIRRVEMAPDDTGAMFSAGLCLSLLAAIGNGMEARDLYEQACGTFEKLLNIDDQSRIACFNCGLSYISLARIEDAETDAVAQKEWTEKALRQFERALVLKPGDAKATAYADECRRQLNAVSPP